MSETGEGGERLKLVSVIHSLSFKATPSVSQIIYQIFHDVKGKGDLHLSPQDEALGSKS